MHFICEYPVEQDHEVEQDWDNDGGNSDDIDDDPDYGLNDNIDPYDAPITSTQVARTIIYNDDDKLPGRDELIEDFKARGLYEVKSIKANVHKKGKQKAERPRFVMRTHGENFLAVDAIEKVSFAGGTVKIPLPDRHAHISLNVQVLANLAHAIDAECDYGD